MNQTLNQTKKPIREANELYRKARFDEAILYYRLAIKRYPSISKSLLHCAFACSERIRKQGENGSISQNVAQRPDTYTTAATHQRIAVYTAITGEYDELRKPIKLPSDIEFIVFSDTIKEPNSSSANSNIRPIAEYTDIDPTRIARFAKTHPHLLLPCHDITVWIDGNVDLKPDFFNYLRAFTTNSELVILRKHPHRGDVTSEAAKCIELHKDTFLILARQLKKYNELHKSDSIPMFETNVIVRSNSRKIAAFNETWWAEIQAGSRRDQISIGFALLANDIKYEIFPETTDIRDSTCNLYSLRPHLGSGPGSRKTIQKKSVRADFYNYSILRLVSDKLQYSTRVKNILVKINELGLQTNGITELKDLVRKSNDSSLRSEASLALASEYLDQDSQSLFVEAREIITNVLDATEKSDNAYEVVKFAFNESLIATGEALPEPNYGEFDNVDFLIQQLATTGNIGRIDILNKVFALYSLSSVKLESAESSSLLDIVPVIPFKKEEHVQSKHKVSIIMPCYNCQETVFCSASSILNQTWKNIEVILINDCSTDDTSELLRFIQTLDNRVKILNNPQNRGPYSARNLGVQTATGDFITVADSDDWHHPEKIEFQVSNLICNRHLVANCASWFRATEDLFPVRRKKFSYHQLNISSLMISRDAFLQHLGCWDEVRFGGDSELYKRALKAFGRNNLIELDAITSISLVRKNSLTHTNRTGYNGYPYGARRDYKMYYEGFHRSDPNSLKYRVGENRNYLVPACMSNQGDYTGKRDIIVAADFRIKSEAERAIDFLETFYSCPEKIDFFQINSYSLDPLLPVHPLFLEKLLTLRKPLLTFADSVQTNVLLVLNGKIFGCPQKLVPNVRASRLVVCSYDKKLLSKNQRKNLIDAFPGNQDTLQDVYYSSIQKDDLKSSFTDPLDSFSKDSYIQSLQICNSSQVQEFAYSGSRRSCIIMPCIDMELGLKCAHSLLQRAGTDCSIIIAFDDLRQGFIKTLNSFAKFVDSRYIIYLAQDVLPGRDWLLKAYQSITMANAGLLAFNDGKWHGRIASFGMIEKKWINSIYNNMILCDEYRSHKADNEITVIARALDRFVYCPDSILFENSLDKDVKGGSNSDDDAIFESRYLSCFGGLITKDSALKFSKEYKVNMD